MATRRQTYGGDFFVDLGRSEALGVGVLAGGHLEHAHAEGVDVDGLVVVLLVHLGRHELGRADDRLGERAVLQRGQAQVADLDAARRPRDEDVVALWHQTKETTKTNQRTPFFFVFSSAAARNVSRAHLEIAVDDGGRARVQKVEALEDLPAPRLEHFQVDLFEAPQVPAHRVEIGKKTLPKEWVATPHGWGRDPPL